MVLNIAVEEAVPVNCITLCNLEDGAGVLPSTEVIQRARSCAMAVAVVSYERKIVSFLRFT